MRERRISLYMDFSGRIVLSFIEEDNIQRAYFRIRPLLTEDGPLGQADIDALPDDGYLRIVPDKNEQHTFKERMRELGVLCVLDLCNIPPETAKIRTNKNYAPYRGENNQYIVYSDAVRSIPQQLFYEVISAELGEKEKIGRAVTPLCYLRSGGRIFGPVSRATGLEQEGASPLAPDSEGIYDVTLPDGAQKLFYWPHSAAAEAAPQLAGEALMEQAPRLRGEERLSGMPLYKTMARRPLQQQRAHNPLVDAVGQQISAGRIEAPGAVLSHGAALRPVENPMEAFKNALNTLWTMPEMQRQAAAQFLSMTGVQNILNQQLCGHASDAVTAAMNSQIQDLEAERLALIMQVEAARKDMAALRREAVEQAAQDAKEGLRRLEEQLAAARADMDRVEAERSGLLAQRDAVLAEMEAAAPDTVLVRAQVGGHAELNTLCERMSHAMRARGIACDKNDALHLLALVTLCPEQIELRADTAADSLAACRALAQALGAQPADALGGEKARLQAGGDGFALLVSAFSSLRPAGFTRVIADLHGCQTKNESGCCDYAAAPWPVAYLTADKGWQSEPAPAYPPVKVTAVMDALRRACQDPPEDAVRLLGEIAEALHKAGAPLSAQVRHAMYRYLSCVAGLMDGGVAGALDYAVSAWVVPHVRRGGVGKEAVLACVQGLQKSTRLLEG